MPIFFTLRAFTTGGFDTRGELYDSGGTLLATNTDSGTGNNFDLSYNITTAGTYYVWVLENTQGMGVGMNTGMYSLTVTTTAGDHGNTRGSATRVAGMEGGTTVDGNIDPDTDEDYFSIIVSSVNSNSLAAPHFVIPTADALVLRATTTGTTNTIGTIYDSSGRELATDDDGGSTGTNFDVSARAAYYGTYYVKVASESMDTGMYSLTVTATSADHSDTLGDSATPLRNGEKAGGEINPDTDEDYFSIEVPRAGTLTAISSNDSFTDGALYNSGGGTALATDTYYDNVVYLNFNISHPIADEDIGTYYIKVSSDLTGEYDLTVTLDSHSDARDASATEVTSGTAVAGEIAPFDDTDYFKITVTGPGTLRATTTGGTNTIGYLYDSSGNVLASDTVGSGTGQNFNISHSITTAGTYYIRVDGVLGAYTLTVTFTP